MSFNQLDLEKLKRLVDTLRAQGVTNLRQLIAWLRSIDVTEKIIAYLQAHPGLQGVIYWVAAFGAGLIAVIYARLFGDLSILAQQISVRWPVLLAFLSPGLFLLAWWLVDRFAPTASGSGIPQVMAAIEADQASASRWVGIRISIVKFFSSLFCALGGGAIGREGPTIQIAASLFYSLGMRFKHIWPSLNHQSLLVAGGSAGIAAAFNTPLGGIVFAVEELSQQHFSRFKTFLISAVIISGLVAQWLLGPYLYLGYPRLASVALSSIPWALVVGLICGVLGAAFGKLLNQIQEKTCQFGFKRRVQLALASGLLMAAGGVFLGPDVLGGGTEMITRVLFDEPGSEVTWGVLAGRLFGPIVTYSSGVAGGIFAPSLAAGAAVGAKLGDLLSSSYPNLLVLLGMAAFLSGVTRAPFTAFVLVLEMTDRHSAIFPLMMASLVASLAGKLVDNRSFYERRCAALLGRPLRVDEDGEDPPPTAASTSARPGSST